MDRPSTSVGGARARADDPRGVLIQFDAFCARLPASTRNVARAAYYRLRTAGDIDFRRIKSLEELLFKLQITLRRDLADSERQWREMMDDFEKAYRAWKAEFKQEIAIRTRNGEMRAAEDTRCAETRRLRSLEERAKRGIIDPGVITGWGRRYGSYAAE